MDHFRQRLIILPRTAGHYSGRKGGVVVFESIYSFIHCWGMWRETTRCDEYWQKRNPLVVPEGERCYSSKEFNLRSFASKQSRVFCESR